MDKVLYYYFFLWNFLNLRLAGATYDGFPRILGGIGFRGRKGKLTIGNGVIINSNRWINPVGLCSRTYFCFYPGAIISIGNNVGISNSLFFAKTLIVIENDVKIGGGCQLFDSDLHSLDPQVRRTEQDQSDIVSRGIYIRSGVLIGASSIILKGVEIGENSIIGAGSVVTRSIPAFEIWAGNPARFIKRIEN